MTQERFRSILALCAVFVTIAICFFARWKHIDDSPVGKELHRIADYAQPRRVHCPKGYIQETHDHEEWCVKLPELKI